MQTLPEQQPEQVFDVQRHAPSTHSCPGPQAAPPPHMHCPPAQRSAAGQVHAGPLPQTQTPRGSHVSVRAGSHITQLMPPVPQVLKVEGVQRPW